MKSSILRGLRRGALGLLCVSILASASTAFAASKANGATSAQETVTTTTTATSVNWSGYAQTTDTFTNVQGTVTVPVVTCTVPGAESLFWVGMDGYNGQTVEQDGVGAVCSKTAKPTPKYFAWWEMFNATGASMHTVSGLTVKPGDKVKELVAFNGTSKGYTLQLTDTSTKQKTFSTVQYCAADQYVCAHQSAEWIAERYYTGTGYTPLAKWKYSATLFTGAEASTGTKLEPLSYYAMTDITMISARTNWHALDSVGAMGNGGTSFGVTWIAAQ